MKLPAYPRSKPSGVEWLDDVPEHWDVKRSDAIVSADRRQLSPEKFADCEVFHYSIPVVQDTGTGQIENGESIASAKQVIKKPVVLVSKLNPRKATICLAKPQAILTLCSTEFVALNADKCELAFLEYLTRSELFRQGLDSKVQSVTRSHQRANSADIYKFWNAWPTLEDQRAIAAFLDRETGRVDRLVAKKRELIERLKEKRTALLSRTVTRGLPPAAARAAGLPENSPLKPSGLGWLGEIPNDWKISTLRRGCSDIFLGLTSTVDYVDDGGFPLVRALNIAGGKLDFSEARHISEEQHRQLTKYRRAKRNDVLLSKSGSIGTCALVGTDRQFSIYESIFALRAHPSLLYPKYLLHLLRSDVCQAQYLASLVGMGVGHLNMSDITEVLIALPPLPEQAAIAAYLDEETAKLDALVGKVEEAVERLQEYRTALITAAVTGKIDVRIDAPRN